MNAELSSMEMEPPADHQSGDLQAGCSVSLFDRLVELLIGTGPLRDAPAH